VPTLVSDSGKAYFGSQTIVQYLDRVAGGNKLLSATDLEARTDELTLESIADAIMDAAVLIRVETFLRPKELRWNDYAEAQMGKIKRGLKSLSERLPGSASTNGALLPDPAVAGPLPLGGIAAAVALWYLDLRFDDTLGWRLTAEGKPLREWYEGAQKRPSWKD